MPFLHPRFRPAYALAGILLAVSFATRAALFLRPDVPPLSSPLALLHVFGVGFLFDLAAAAYFTLPLALYLTLLPQRLARSRLHTVVLGVMFLACTYLLLVVAASEWVFWDEFGARFNFIAVDYLVYTHEVLGNIWESYPVGVWLSVLGLPALFAWWPIRKHLDAAVAMPAPWGPRLRAAAPFALLPVIALLALHTGQKDLSRSDAENELAGNGIYEFFAANLNNELSYPRFYATLPPERAMLVARDLVGGADAVWIGSSSRAGMHREVYNPAPDKRLNVVLVSIESLGAEFLGAFGNAEGLTPNIDALSAESLTFTQLYATGNRTVRGMEALALSLPPTPGQSIVKRPGNEELFTLGSIFEDRGYDTSFVYGGYGYFDNLNYFFSHNDYRVIDRTALTPGEISHETIWGVADEDLFGHVLRDIDRAMAQPQHAPFFMHVLTTSNHRPYTYPAGRIDIPSGSGRSGAVKYTDYAVGKFIREARGKPWFKDTIFLITADHGASARGTSEIPLAKYRIPLLVYSPGHVRPGRFDRLMSQIDIAPTLLGLLDMGYSSKFFGHDVFRTPPGDDRALVANYQTLGYMKDGMLVTLLPKQQVRVRALPEELGLPAARGDVNESLLREEAISLYESASLVYRAGLGKDEERNGVAPQRMAGAQMPAQP